MGLLNAIFLFLIIGALAIAILRVVLRLSIGILSFLLSIGVIAVIIFLLLLV